MAFSLNSACIGTPGSSPVHPLKEFRETTFLRATLALLATTGYHPNQEAVMDDSQSQEARTPRTHRYVPELEMLESLNRSLWEVERARVEEAAQEKLRK
jgi:hypothetical protein